MIMDMKIFLIVLSVELLAALLGLFAVWDIARLTVKSNKLRAKFDESDLQRFQLMAEGDLLNEALISLYMWPVFLLAWLHGAMNPKIYRD